MEWNYSQHRSQDYWRKEKKPRWHNQNYDYDYDRNISYHRNRSYNRDRSYDRDRSYSRKRSYKRDRSYSGDRMYDRDRSYSRDRLQDYYKNDYRSDYRNDYRDDYRNYYRKENHRDFKDQRYKRKHKDYYEDTYDKDNHRTGFKNKDRNKDRDQNKDWYRDDSFDKIRSRSKENGYLYDADDDDDDDDDGIFDSEIERVHTILQTMSQEKEMAIGFMFIFSENPDKILDSIHSPADVDYLIAERIECGKVRRLKIWKRTPWHYWQYKFTKLFESCKLWVNKFGHRFDARFSTYCVWICGGEGR